MQATPEEALQAWMFIKGQQLLRTTPGLGEEQALRITKLWGHIDNASLFVRSQLLSYLNPGVLYLSLFNTQMLDKDSNLETIDVETNSSTIYEAPTPVSTELEELQKPEHSKEANFSQDTPFDEDTFVPYSLEDLDNVIPPNTLAILAQIEVEKEYLHSCGRW